MRHLMVLVAKSLNELYLLTEKYGYLRLHSRDTVHITTAVSCNMDQGSHRGRSRRPVL